ncbi:MAG: hypothetical protein ACRDL0_17750 [Thermoleophilaceae bacterium]
MYTRVLRGEIRELPSWLADLLYSSLLPYLGPGVATRERLRVLENTAQPD